MVDTNELKKRLDLLANENPKLIISEMEKEIQNCQTAFGRITNINPNINGKIKAALNSLKSKINIADKIAIPLFSLEESIHSLESKPSIQRYHEYKEKVNSPNCQAVERASLHQELRKLKSANSIEISSIISKKQESVVQRLKLIQCWKSLVHDEIRFLEDFQKMLIDNLMSVAEEIGDPELLKEIQEKIQSLEISNKKSKPSQISQSSLELKNIKSLKVTMRYHLDEVVRLDKMINEKKQQFECLSSIVLEYQKKVTPLRKDISLPPAEDKSSATYKTAPVKAKDSQKKDSPLQKGRMVFIDKSK